MSATPRRIGVINVTVTIPGGGKLSAQDRAKLENGANTCPVKQSLHPDIKMPVKFVYE